MKKNILARLMLAFIFATTLSAMLSFLLANYLNIKSTVQQLRADEISIAENFIDICNTTDADIDYLTEQFSTSLYIVSVMDGDAVNAISQSDLKKVFDGEILTVSKFLHYDTDCIFKVKNSIISIKLNSENDMINSFGTRLGTIMIGTLLLSACMMFFISFSVTKPIRQLSAATKKVAKGDFNVQVDVEVENEIGQLAKSFNSMVNELKSNEMLKKDFISNVSHELKTPLSTINGFAKLLREGSCSANEVSEYAEIIDSETSRLSTLCSNILRLSKIENQKISIQHENFRLDEQIRDVILILEPQWSTKNLELDIELDECTYCSDEELLQQVWLNLIGNAVKFTPAGGKLTVILKNSKGNITVAVADTGIGISEEAQKHIFEKFYQGERSHHSDGNGLGLALVKEILNACCGNITVKSKLNAGSVFTVTLTKEI